MVETIFGDHRFGWMASDVRLGGLGRDYIAHRHTRHRSDTAVRL